MFVVDGYPMKRRGKFCGNISMVARLVLNPSMWPFTAPRPLCGAPHSVGVGLNEAWQCSALFAASESKSFLLGPSGSIFVERRNSISSSSPSVYLLPTFSSPLSNHLDFKVVHAHVGTRTLLIPVSMRWSRCNQTSPNFTG